MVNSDIIKKFWEWFSIHCHEIGNNHENTILLGQLDEWINRLGNFSWEIGPGKEKENSLVISPNGDPDLLIETKKIIAAAEACIGWEYYYAKPQKNWKLRFEFETSDEKVLEIDASQWQYCLLKYEDGMFEIIIKAPGSNRLQDGDKLTAAEITLDSLLGEELRMQTICQIEVVEEFEETFEKKATNIECLPNHLRAVH